MKKIRDALLIILIFLFLYRPPIINFNILHIIGAISWCYLLLKIKIISVTPVNFDIIKIFIISLLFFFYIVIICILNGNSIYLSNAYMIIDVIPFGLMMGMYFKEHHYQFIGIINLILCAGLIQALFAIMAFLFSPIQTYFVNKLISYGYNDVVSVISSFRIYGYSVGLTFSTPILQSILAIITIYLALFNKRKYIFLSVPLIFSALINARTSIIVLVIGMILLLYIDIKNKKQLSIFKLILYILVAVLVMELIILILERISPITYTWIKQGFDDILSLFGGDEVSYSYFDYMMDSDNYPLPSGIKTLFGVGVSILGGSIYGVASDIGYINDIWVGGIIYSLAIYIFYGWATLKMIKNKNGLISFLGILFGLSFIFLNIKGQIFVMNDMTNLFFMLLCIILTNKDVMILSYDNNI